MINAAEKKTVHDQMGEAITFTFPPKRILSLVPSQTELLHALSLDLEVIGLTKFCVHPQHWLQNKTIVGGTKNFWFDVIDALNPDLIIGNKEENYKEGIVTLKEKYPVWMSDIVTWQDALNMMQAVGDITDRSANAKKITTQAETAFTQLEKASGQSVLYLIWKKPWMGAGNETFINTLLEKIGFVNSLKGRERYPTLGTEEIYTAKADLIFLSSEPYPFKEQHVEELKRISPSSQIVLVDGEMFSWYGSRLLEAATYFNDLIKFVSKRSV